VELEGNHAEPAFVASDVMDAALAALIAREGLQPLDPPERSEDESIKAQRLLEADEALLPVLKCRDDSCQVSLHRRKARGGTLKISDPFEVQAGFENAYLLAEGVQSHVQQVYSGYRLRPGLSAGSVRAEDYTAYAELQRRADRGERLGEPELDELDALLRRSPGLMSAYALAAGIAYNRKLLDRALDYVVQAENVAPFDPRPLFTRLRIEVEEARLDEARETLERLADLVPGDIRLQGAEADLLEAKNELQNAHVLRKKLARRRPAWRNILKLATLEFRLGASEDALRRLKDLLAVQPDNEYVWENVAAVEAVYGDLNRAAGLYEKLSRTSAEPYLKGLCFVRYLLGEYAAAIALGDSGRTDYC
jgi:tetratricopeptide (TPR) repeat protein